jgi:hypothetical protein
MLEADVRGKYEAWGARRTDINLDRAKMNGWSAAPRRQDPGSDCV